MLETCTMPLCRSTASMISGVPARDPVCASIAWRAFSDRPTLSITMGFASARARAAACRNVSGFLNPSNERADNCRVVVLDQERDVVLDRDAGLVAARHDVAEPDR